jgi:molybdopterin/thiamine biosynthesis adenylyltransferase/rhodanese-related sulfurtransferase
MASFRDLLAQTKTEIREVDTAAADEARRRAGTAVLDVREPDEYDQGALPGAIHIPRGHLESQIEGKIVDKQTPVVVYCAGGVRSAFAAKTLQDLGYADVVSMAGGFGRWKDEGRDWLVPVTLTAEQRNRYARHLLLPEVGVEGQAKLLVSKVLLLGAAVWARRPRLPRRRRSRHARHRRHGRGRRAEPAAPDPAQRRSHRRAQGRLGQEDLDRPQLRVDVVAYDTRLSADNVLDLIDGYDVIIDGADNFPSRYLLNDASLLKRIPVVHGSIFRFEGQATVFDPYNGPCYRCMIPEPPPAELAPSCAEAGVLGVLPGIIGSIQALEAVKILLGLGETLRGRLLAYDALEQSFRTFKVLRDPKCPACSIDPSEIVIAEYDELCMPHRAH